MDYFKTIKAIKPKKRFGQNFLINRHIAEFEAEFGINKNIIEIGPGLGILTRELLKKARNVIAIEKDITMYLILKQEFINEKKLHLINKDVFNINWDEIEKQDIIISNIPYNMSSRMLDLIASLKIDGVFCLQKEFVDHMQAQEGTNKYSMLSVFSKLQFDIKILKRINANNFYPIPKVNSAIIYIKFKNKIDHEILHIISLIMIHKKKNLKNALLDSAYELKLEKKNINLFVEKCTYSNQKVFKISPNNLVEIANKIKNWQNSSK